MRRKGERHRAIARVCTKGRQEKGRKRGSESRATQGREEEAEEGGAEGERGRWGERKLENGLRRGRAKVALASQVVAGAFVQLAHMVERREPVRRFQLAAVLALALVLELQRAVLVEENFLWKGEREQRA